MKTYGKILPRSMFDKNEITIHDDYATISLYNSSHEKISEAIIDIDDIDKVKEYKWRLTPSGYVATKGSFLHRIVTDCPSNKIVDHINHNPLDNRKANLRVCTQRENVKNKVMQKNNTSGYIGVYWSKELNKWYSRICVDGTNIHLGYFVDILEAAEAYRKAIDKYFGVFAYHEEEL